MSPLATPATTWVGSLSRSQLAVRALVVVGPVVATLASGPAGHWPPWWILLVVVALSAAFSVVPESAVGAGALLVVLIWWTVSPSDRLHPAVLVAAGALLGTHVAATLASYGPGEMPIPASLLRLWVRRTVLVLLVIPPVWGLARLLEGEAEQPGIWVLGTAAALVATIAGGIALTTGPGQPDKH